MQNYTTIYQRIFPALPQQKTVTQDVGNGGIEGTHHHNNENNV